MAFCPGCGVEVPADARFCPACGLPLGRRHEPGEERKLASVLFADLVRSTQLADAQDPERTRALLERFYDAMSSEIERAGGTVEKVAGAAVMEALRHLVCRLLLETKKTSQRRNHSDVGTSLGDTEL